jgi:micrococcal nuclease
MKKIQALVVVLLVCSAQITHAEKNYGSAIGTVVSVYDGDTITVDLDEDTWPPLIGEKIGVRVFGVDTRELREGGLPAKAFVQALIPVGSTVRLSEILRDKYFRIVAKVGYNCTDLESDNPTCSDLSLTLIKHKFAIPYDGGTKAKFPKDIK